MAQIFFAGDERSVPVNTIYCIGRNYAEHAGELNNPIPQSPIVFIKPATTIIHSGEFIELPRASSEVHHEVEVVALVGKPGKHIAPEAALEHLAGYGIGIDVTARDVQEKAKQKSHPWAVAKGFDTFAPVSSFVKAERVGDPGNLDFQLLVNGETRQAGNTRDMLFPIAELIAYLSSIFTLLPGDLLFTGTPKGVSRLHEGDKLRAILGDNLVALEVEVRKERYGH